MNDRVNTLTIAAASTLPGTDGVPKWVKLVPAGSFKLRDGRGPFRAGDTVGELQAVVDRSLAYASNTELMMDYDHQSVFGAIPNVGGTAPASGWMKAIEARADGIWAQVAWTEAAAAKIAALEYRYISPLFTYDNAGAIGRIVNAALVNAPAIDQKAIAAALATLNPKEDAPMKKIALALGLADTASEDAILAAMNSNAEQLAVAAGLTKDAPLADVVKTVAGFVAGAGQIAVAAGLQVGATSEQIVAAMATSVGATVPKASFDKLSADFVEFKKSTEAGKVETAVAAALEAGKVTPANKAWAIAYCTNDPAGFATFVENAPVLTGAQLGDRDTKANDLADPVQLAAAATTFQKEQAAAGVTISYAEAVVAVRDRK
jgi:phage I-like protein